MWVRPDLVQAFTARGWNSATDVLNAPEVEVNRHCGVRDNCVVKFPASNPAASQRVYLKRHRRSHGHDFALAEAEAVEVCRQAGIQCMEIAAVGVSSDSQDSEWHSFFMSFEVGQSESVMDLAISVVKSGDPAGRDRLQLFLNEVALVMRAMHDQGLFHRDCYLDHFILDSTDESRPATRIIDLQATRRLIGRSAIYARIKDLEHLSHSMNRLGLTAREIREWRRCYFAGNSGQPLPRQQSFLIQMCVPVRQSLRRIKGAWSNFFRPAQQKLAALLTSSRLSVSDS
ncbi:MAG: lipopolysaccharide kinase InaA family protein, partial [Planctomycetaceae bacterium]